MKRIVFDFDRVFYIGGVKSDLELGSCSLRNTESKGTKESEGEETPGLD